ncbi:MAG: hypothetical protein ACLS9K_07845 [Lachnospira eligens]
MVNAKSNVTIYSIVNSLSDWELIALRYLSGNSNLMYRDAISLDTVFYMNNELVKRFI